MAYMLQRSMCSFAIKSKAVQGEEYGIFFLYSLHLKLT